MSNESAVDFDGLENELKHLVNLYHAGPHSSIFMLDSYIKHMLALKQTVLLDDIRYSIDTIKEAIEADYEEEDGEEEYEA